jgi:hypothetical protein
MDRTAAPEALVRALAETTTRTEAVTRRLSAVDLATGPGPGAWSPNEVLWHIRASADVYGEHVARILDEDTPVWRRVSPRARMKKSRYDQLPFAESFAAFAKQREALVALLGGVVPDAWQRFAIIHAGQRASRLTLRERIRGMADHEDIHCAQTEHRRTPAATRGEHDEQ